MRKMATKIARVNGLTKLIILHRLVVIFPRKTLKYYCTVIYVTNLNISRTLKKFQIRKFLPNLFFFAFHSAIFIGADKLFLKAVKI